MADQSPPPSAASGPRLPPDPDPEPGDSISPSSSASSSFRSRTPAIHHLSFNQDYSRFAAGLDNGFSVYISDPFRLCFRRASDSRCCGVGLVAMLYRSDTFCLVGGGPNPVYATHKVMIFDDRESRFSGELSFPSEVKNVEFRPDWVVVVLAHRILVFNFADLKVVRQIETVLNPKGLCEISSSSPPMVLACPGVQKGQIRVDYGSSRSRIFVGHDSKLACMAMTADGRLLASACEKGTLIRIFNTLDGQLLQEVRRGSERAEIYSLAFSPRAQWLALSSDKGTVHVFTLKIDFSKESPNVLGSLDSDSFVM